MWPHGGKAALIGIASGAADATSGGFGAAIIVAVIGMVGLLLQIFVKDALESRRRRRAAAEPDDADGLRADLTALREELADERRENARLRREMERRPR